MQPKMTQEQAERAYKLLVSLWCEQNGLELVSLRFVSHVDKSESESMDA